MGAKAALQATGPGEVTAAGEQLSLLSGGPLGVDPAADAPAGGERRGPGRPPGSRNKRTEELVELLQRQGHKSPLQVISEMVRDFLQEPVAFRQRLGMSTKEASELVFGRLIPAALPYWHSKAPVELVNEGGGPLMVVNFGVPLEPGEGRASAAQGPFQAVRIIDQDEGEGESENAEESST